MSDTLPMMSMHDLLDSPAAAHWNRLRDGDDYHPHDLLGAHPGTVSGESGAIVRAYHPEAVGVEIHLDDGAVHDMIPVADGGLFAGFVVGATAPLTYWLRFKFSNGNIWDRQDPYRFPPTLGEVDLHLFNEGTHRKLYEHLGAHCRCIDGVEGTSFAVWAPNAKRVSVVGDFCGWDGRLCPMRSLGSSGVWEIFLPDVGVGAFYKFEIKTQDDYLRIKSDPMGFAFELPPHTSSRVWESSYDWSDNDWMDAAHGQKIVTEPVSIYEVHLGSWRRIPEEGNRWLSYREIAKPLIDHVKRFGFTHIELMPVAEHPYGGSWGYQVTGYFAPTSRFGSPDDFKYFVDQCHQHGIGVILDWVPAHFPKDDFALRRFDGTALYEHADPRQGEHPDWGTLIFNYGRHEVVNFLTANALCWLKEYHVDALRVDAVASMLYLDYSRKDGEWIPNKYGGKENIEAIQFLQTTNRVIREECPHAFTIAEESTGWSGATREVEHHGLGFTFKWNMGWMNDTLRYFSANPVYRKYHHNDLTFSMLYEYSERFINPLSHDEVVHGKGSLLEKMPCDLWQKFANLRLLMGYQFTRPGKKLNFMGTELAPHNEWYYDSSLDWHLAEDPERQGFATLLEDLGALYKETPCLWAADDGPFGFSWLDCADYEQSILSFVRRHNNDFMIVVMNLTPVPRDHYRIGVPAARGYREVICTDSKRYAGSGYAHELSAVEKVAQHGFDQSVRMNLPPLSVTVLAPQ